MLRAKYSWGISGNVIWLKDELATKSLTNDIENCLEEISKQLPKGKHLSDYSIIYRDSDGQWDGVDVVDYSNISVVFYHIGLRDQKQAETYAINH